MIVAPVSIFRPTVLVHLIFTEKKDKQGHIFITYFLNILPRLKLSVCSLFEIRSMIIFDHKLNLNFETMNQHREPLEEFQLRYQHAHASMNGKLISFLLSSQFVAPSLHSYGK
jgi:hypothetical protein